MNHTANMLTLTRYLYTGHKVVAFLPDYYLDMGKVGDLRRMAKLDIGEVRAAKLPDDVQVQTD